MVKEVKMNKYEFWFIVGSQHLYGQETLEQVDLHTKEMVEALNKSEHLKHKIVYKGIATSADKITNLMKEANYRDEVAGVITWMHTFSPAKMWIKGTKLLQKPLLHLATQFNREIPWKTIDMDFMNLNQSAHGDREYGYINARLKKNNKVVFGYWKDEAVQKKIGNWMLAAIGYAASQEIKVARFGDNMRNVAVTEGDKVEAQIKFGWTVDYFAIGDLVKTIDEVTQDQVDALLEEYKTAYDFEYDKDEEDYFFDSLREQAKIELGLESFLKENGYNAFTTNFEDLYGMKQLPGLAVQRLVSKGYGFAAEGDWKTAALNRLLKVMADNKATGFTEDYTYELSPGKEAVLEAHMLEVDPTLAGEKAKVIVKALSIGGKEDPARLIFDSKLGNAVVVSMADFGNEFKLLISDVEVVRPEEKAPNLPVARVYWKLRPDLETGVTRWIEEGGGHHSVVSMELCEEQIVDLAKMFELKHIIIK
ncbi:MAG: L-arabinose isomerase [Tissierellia bacterium]|nr:L-arabinose isomerase [Tissierellia bacterium]